MSSQRKSSEQGNAGSELILSSAPRARAQAELPLADVRPPLRSEGIPSDNEFFIPVHGFVGLRDEEVAVVNHPAFQRLGFIYQLGQSNLVFRGATHKRLEHVLGTLHVVQEMIDAVHQNHRRAARKRKNKPAFALDRPFDKTIELEEEAFVRLGALLHDIGHLPAGHTLEDELQLLDKHDRVARITAVLDRDDWPGNIPGSLRSVIDAQYADWADGIELSPSEILIQLVASDARELHESQFVEANKAIRVEVCRDMIGNTICADLLDYLHRDWYHIGKPKYFDKRLFQYMEIRLVDGHPRFVISIGNYPKIRSDAVTAMLGLLESRYELAETVLFHRTKCSSAAMLERALFEIDVNLSRDSEKASAEESNAVERKRKLEMHLLDTTDEGSLDVLLGLANDLKSAAAIHLIEALRARNLYSVVTTSFLAELTDAQRSTVQGLYRGSKGAEARNRAMRQLEADFNLRPGVLAIYCPDRGMNSKIAKVKVLANGQVKTLSEWDAERPALAGGHLHAQLERFESLWRVHVVIDRKTWSELGGDLQDSLKTAVNICVLRKIDPDRTIEQAVKQDVLKPMLVTKSSPYYGKDILEEPRIAARGGGVELSYPSGAPSLSAFFDDK